MPLTARRVTLWTLSVAAVCALLLFALGASQSGTASGHAAATPASTGAVPAHAMAGHHAAGHATKLRAADVRATMRTLWAQHMNWTYATVVAFAGDSKGLDATVARLLENQADIGDAVRPFYGAKAADRLTALLQEHITGAVPVLTAAKAGNAKDLRTSLRAWHVNARQIADFLAGANPHWKKPAMRKMMKRHIDQTVTYAGAVLAGRWAKAIAAYDRADAHMAHMADMLTNGLVKQFPQRLR